MDIDASKLRQLVICSNYRLPSGLALRVNNLDGALAMYAGPATLAKPHGFYGFCGVLARAAAAVCEQGDKRHNYFVTAPKWTTNYFDSVRYRGATKKDRHLFLSDMHVMSAKETEINRREIPMLFNYLGFACRKSGLMYWRPQPKNGWPRVTLGLALKAHPMIKDDVIEMTECSAKEWLEFADRIEAELERLPKPRVAKKLKPEGPNQ